MFQALCCPFVDLLTDLPATALYSQANLQGLYSAGQANLTGCPSQIVTRCSGGIPWIILGPSSSSLSARISENTAVVFLAPLPA